MKKYVKIFLQLTISLSAVFGARILGVFPYPSTSHQIVFRELMTELHSRGHHIVVLTPNPIRNPDMKNYTEIDLSALNNYWGKSVDLVKIKSYPSLRFFVASVMQLSKNICKTMFDIPEVKAFTSQPVTHIDVVIAQWLVTPCAYGYASHFSAPLIGFSSMGLMYSGHDSVGNPTHPTYTNDIFLPYNDRPLFSERLYSVFYSLWFRWLWHRNVLPEQDAIAREHFGNTMPYIGDLEMNVSLVFTNILSKTRYPRPNVPALIELGGLHLKEPAPLPKDLQEFLDEATEGAIYFSLGSNVRSESMSAAHIQMFLDAFADLPNFSVLWKWGKEAMPKQPGNVKLAKWLPQQDILNHPSVKVFIYQGGLQSTEETIRAKIPIIGIPFYADQELNVRKMVESGAGVKLEYNELSKEAILMALKKIINEPSYKTNIKRLSDLMKDQPETPLQRAVWWTEYVIRHKGARHLRSSTIDLTWYQYLLLDVIAFIIVTSVITLWFTYRGTRLILRILVSSYRPGLKRD